MGASVARTPALQRSVNRLIAVVRDEIAAHERLDALLQRQQDAVTTPSSEAFQAATVDLEAELSRAPHRARRRAEAFALVGDALGVPASALTLSSICERLGDAAGPLAADRDALESAATSTRRRARRVTALVRMHREVTRDLLRVVLGAGDAPGGDVLAGGTLIDAEV